MDGGWGGQVAREVKGVVHSVACLGCSCWGRHWESWRLGGCIGEMKWFIADKGQAHEGCLGSSVWVE
jgi:hypothetical protein